MAFFASAIDTLKILVIALGAGLGAWGVVNLLEGYGNDNPGAKSQGIKQLMAGGGIALVGATLIPLLSGLFGYDAVKLAAACGIPGPEKGLPGGVANTASKIEIRYHEAGPLFSCVRPYSCDFDDPV